MREIEEMLEEFRPNLRLKKLAMDDVDVGTEIGIVIESRRHLINNHPRFRPQPQRLLLLQHDLHLQVEAVIEEEKGSAEL